MSQDSMDRLIPAARQRAEEGVEGHSSATRGIAPVVLIVDDDPLVQKAHQQVLSRSGMRAIAVPSAAAALSLLGHGASPFDVVVSDVVMPGMDGISLLREIRRSDMDVPVVLVTGNAQVESAMDAVSFGGFRYLTKPIATDELIAVVKSATSLHRLARLKREALEAVHAQRRLLGDRASLEVHFVDALASLWVAFQPIFDWTGRRLFGYEALVRASSSQLSTPAALLDAAERLGRVHDVGRRVRAMVAEAITRIPTNAVLFVNLHANDLADRELICPTAPLSASARRVVLEFTERASLDDVSELQSKLGALRKLGYRIAVDDLGAGYAGWTSFSRLAPEFAKLDMSLIRDIDVSNRQQNIVRSMIAVCTRELGVEVICEGVETVAERDTLTDLGARLIQGYLFGRPERHFAVDIPDSLGKTGAPSQEHVG